jgi:periplasmic divalent cation tolerance protein
MSTYFVYVTAKDREEALRIGRNLVEERVVACVNILDGMSSLYWWDGAVQEDQEAVLVAKTTESCVERVVERIKTLHSYECPCAVAWPIATGNPAYLQWVHEEAQPRPTG